VVVGVLEETRVHFHLPAEDGFQRRRHLVPGRDLLRARRELAIRGDDAEPLLPGEDLLAELVPTLVELALVLVSPLLRYMVGRMGGAGGEVDEEGLVGRQRLWLADPLEGLVRHVREQVVALLGRLLQLDRRGPFVERRVPLVRLAADEAVEVLEASAARGPGVEGSGRARLPDRHLVALAELRGGVAVERQRPRQRRHGIRQDRAVARRAARDLGDVAHAGRVVVASGQQRLARRRAQGGRVEAIVLQSPRGQLFQGWHVTRAAEGAGRAEAGVIDQDDEDVRRTGGRTKLRDGRVLRLRILGVVGDLARPKRVRQGQVGALLQARCAGGRSAARRLCRCQVDQDGRSGGKGQDDLNGWIACRVH
jgi:hypothetical protein